MSDHRFARRSPIVEFSAGDCTVTGECAVCHRLSDPGESNCAVCHWPLGEVDTKGAVGFDIALEVREGAVLTSAVRLTLKGSAAAVRRKAKLQVGAVRVLALEPYTAEQWRAAHGEGRM